MRRPLVTMILIGVVVGWRLPQHSTAAVPRAVIQPDRPVETVLQRRDSGHFSTTADVNGEPVNFVVDTGADTIALTLDDARRAHIAFDPGQFTAVAHGAGGDVLGERVHLDSVVLDGKRVSDLSALVLQGNSVSLLGQNYLRHLSVEITGDTMHLR